MRPTDGTDKFTYNPLDTHRGEFVKEWDPKENRRDRSDVCAELGSDGLVYHTEPLANETPLMVFPRSPCGLHWTPPMSI